MIRQYLQGRGYLNRRKAKEGKNRRRGDESEDDDSSEDDTFDPQAALYGNDSDNDADMEENSDDEAGSEDITRADKENRPVGPDIALPDKPTGNANHLLDADEHRCAVFLDQDGFFLDPNDTVLEATYNPKTKLYKMPDGRPLELDAMPESLENYENGFNDGISRMRNASGYWQVGSVIIAREPSLSLPMLQKSVATRKTSKYITNTSHTPTAIAPTAKHASIPNSSTSTSMKIQHDPTTPKSCGQGPAAIVLVPCSPLTDISEVSQFSWEDKKSSTKKTTTKPNAKLSKKVIPAAPPKSTNPGSKTSGPKALLSNPHLKRKRDSEDNELSDRPSRATRSTQTSRDPQVGLCSFSWTFLDL